MVLQALATDGSFALVVIGSPESQVRNVHASTLA